MNNDLYTKIQQRTVSTDAAEIIAGVIALTGEERIVLASSCSIEDQVLTHLLCKAVVKPRIFTLDTGRLFPETYDTMERTMERYGFGYESAVPDTRELEKLLAADGPNLFYRSIELRHECFMSAAGCAK